MDTNERHIKDNETHRHDGGTMETDNPGTGNRLRRNSHRRISARLWLWLGVMILIFILVYWLFSIGIFEDLSGISNG